MKSAFKATCGCLLLSFLGLALTIFALSQVSFDPTATRSGPSKLTDAPSERYLDGLTGFDVTANFESKGFTTEFFGEHVEYKCSFSHDNTHFVVQAFGDSPIRILFVKASVTSADAEIPLQMIAEFLTYSASLPVAGANAEAAANWMSNNWNHNSELIEGTVKYQVFKVPTNRAWLLEMHPSGK